MRIIDRITLEAQLADPVTGKRWIAGVYSVGREGQTFFVQMPAQVARRLTDNYPELVVAEWIDLTGLEWIDPV